METPGRLGYSQPTRYYAKINPSPVPQEVYLATAQLQDLVTQEVEQKGKQSSHPKHCCVVM